jgi:hypothetical protein
MIEDGNITFACPGTMTVNARLFLATAALVTTGWFTNRYSMSALTGLETDSAEGMSTWREYSANFIVASVATV